MNQPQYLPAVENASHPGLMLDGHGVAEFKFATHLGRKGCNKFGIEAFKAGAALEVLAQRVGVFNCHDPLKRCLSSATSCCYLAAERGAVLLRVKHGGTLMVSASLIFTDPMALSSRRASSALRNLSLCLLSSRLFLSYSSS